MKSKTVDNVATGPPSVFQKKNDTTRCPSRENCTEAVKRFKCYIATYEDGHGIRRIYISDITVYEESVGDVHIRSPSSCAITT